MARDRMRGVRFLFLLTEGFGETVIDSQVVDPVVALRKEGLRFDILSLTDGQVFLRRRAYYAQRCREIAARTGGRVAIWPIARKRKDLGLVVGVSSLALELARGGFRPAVIHARGEWAARFSSQIARWFAAIRFVYDVRGDSEAEHRLISREHGLPVERAAVGARQIDRLRAELVARADHLLCVSNPLRDLLERRYGLERDRCTVVPCAADEAKFHPDESDRAAMRRELGLEDRFVVVFPGRFARWHYNEETLRLVRALLDADERVFFQVLTPDLEAAMSLAGRLLPRGRYDIRSAAHGEVPRYLRAADLGILLRDEDPVNAVACPTKFGEFVMTGLPVAISAGIGDCSAFVAEHRAGVVLERLEPDVLVRGLRELELEDGAERRARIADLGTDRFSRKRYIGEVAALYRRLAQIS